MATSPLALISLGESIPIDRPSPRRDRRLGRGQWTLYYARPRPIVWRSLLASAAAAAILPAFLPMPWALASALALGLALLGFRSSEGQPFLGLNADSACWSPGEEGSLLIHVTELSGWARVGRLFGLLRSNGDLMVIDLSRLGRGDRQSVEAALLCLPNHDCESAQAELRLRRCRRASLRLALARYSLAACLAMAAAVLHAL